MGTLISSLHDNSFNKKLSSTYGLSALVSEDRFCFMVCNDHNELLLFREYHKEQTLDKTSQLSFLKATLKKDDLLHLPFGKVNMAVFNQKQTLIPSRLFIESEKTYLEKLVDLLPADQVMSDSLKPLRTQVIYAIDLETKEFLAKTFSDIKLFHGTSAILSGLSKLTEFRTGYQLYVNMREGVLDIILFENKDLLFYNIFSFGSSKDVLYNVMLVFDQFNLDPETVPLYLSGQILKDSEIYQLFFRYIRKIQFLGTPEYISLGPAFQQFRAHHYFDLFSLTLCE